MRPIACGFVQEAASLATGPLTRLAQDHPVLLVMSHERSGTHFAMNALAEAFGYVSEPWVDLDYTDFTINYFSPHVLQGALRYFAQQHVANLLKGHHEAAFFTEFLAGLGDVMRIVYVYRGPADVMASYWRFLHSWDWREGPLSDTPLDLAHAEPMGQLMRYQHRQHATMLDRWAAHVAGWTEAADALEHVIPVRYEDLDADYEATVRRLGERLGLAPASLARPSRHEKVVPPGPLIYAPPASADNRDAVAAMALQRYPELMAKLGYTELAKASAERWMAAEGRPGRAFAR